MLIKKLKLKNIKAYKYREFEFLPGINFIKGANGAGKSTIIESIGYCIFDSKNVRKIEEMISFGESFGEIEAEFELNGEEYRIVRTIAPEKQQHKRRWLIFENEILQPLNGANENLTYIKKIFNLKLEPAKYFEKILGAYQGKFKEPFGSTQDSYRAKYFNEIFDTEKYKKAADSGIKDAKKNIEFEIEKCENNIKIWEEFSSDIDKIAAEIDELTKKQLKINGRIENLAKERKNINGKIVEIEKINKEINRNKIEYAKIQRDIENKDKQIKDIESKISQFKNIVKIDGDLLGELKKYMPDILKRANEVLPRMTNEFDLINARINKLEAEKEKYIFAKSQADGLKLLKEQRDDLINKKRGLEEKQKIFDENIQYINNGICPFLSAPCSRITEAEIENNAQSQLEDSDKKLAVLDKQISGLSEFENYDHALKTLIEQLGGEQKAAEELAGEIDKILIKAANYPLHEKIEPFGGNLRVEKAFDDFADQKETIPRAKAYKYWVNIYNDYLNEISGINEHAVKLSEYIPERDKLKKQISDVMKLIDELCEKTKDYDELKKEDKELEADFIALTSEQGSVNADLKSKQVQLNKIREYELKCAEEIKEKERLSYALKFLTDMGEVLRGCGPRVAGIMRAGIAAASGKIYSEIASDLSALEFDENYDICLNDYWQNSLRKRYFSQLSGGEKMSAALSVRLALLMSFSPLNIGFFDEPTENLDVLRRENLSQAFLELLKNLEQSFIISHDDTFDSLTENIVEV